MREFTESRLVFRFDDDWTVEQWDSHPAYRAAGGFGTLPGTAACDFVGFHEAGRVYLVEVKNFTGHHHNNRERLETDGLPVEVSGKVRDTLAGLVWTRGREFDLPPLRDVIDRLLETMIASEPAKVSVVLWLEDRPPVDPLVASALMTDIRRQLLRLFKIRKVLVTSMATHVAGDIPGLTVRPAT